MHPTAPPSSPLGGRGESGLIGKIHTVQDKVVLLEIANGVRVRVLKSSVQGKAVIADETAPAKAEEKKEEK